MRTVMEQVSMPRKIVSDDGKFEVSIGSVNGVPTTAEIEACKKQVLEYEKSARNVLWARLLERGVLKLFKAVSPFSAGAVDMDIKPMDSTVQRYIASYFLDTIYEDGSDMATFYFYLPQTDDDVKDLLTYISMKGQSAFLDNKKNAYGYNSDDCTIFTHRLEAGKRYILAENEDYYDVIALDELTERIKKLQKALTDAAEEK